VLAIVGSVLVVFSFFGVFFSESPVQPMQGFTGILVLISGVLYLMISLALIRTRPPKGLGRFDDSFSKSSDEIVEA